MLAPIGTPDEWHGSNWVLVDDDFELVRTPGRAMRGWHQGGFSLTRFSGGGRLYITVVHAPTILSHNHRPACGGAFR